MRVAFLIGSPRSGTTILENILNCHDRIAELYEPYYLWERHFDAGASDVWDEADLTPVAAGKLRQEFSIFAAKQGKPIVLDKSPVHAFNIPIVRAVFPDARWIHIVRDGRDVTLSIRREWEKRRRQVADKNFFSLFKTAKGMLDRQPVMRFKLAAIRHELMSTFSLNPYQYLNKSRWKGNIGWGPRFSGWEDFLDVHPVIAFNAMQWATTVEAAHTYWQGIPRQNRLEIRYETLLTFPEKTISAILEFLGCQPSRAFFDRVPTLMPENFNKWKTGFTGAQLDLILPILSPMLKTYGYLC